MRIGVRVTGAREHENAMRLLLARIDLSTRDATRDAAEGLRDRTKAHLHTYTHPPTTHRTPSPAFIGPPAWVTGDLERSVGVIGPRIEGRYQWTAYVAPDVVYDRIQELSGFSGRHHATFTPPRPYMTPMAMESAASGAIREHYRATWAVVIGG